MTNSQSETPSVAVIFGSARGDGNTAMLVERLRVALGAQIRVADLSALTIGPFEYQRYDDRDDFRAVVAMMIESNHIVFATPVYWYAMSAPMKGFFDRLTDLLHDPADRLSGRVLGGRNVWLIATGTDRRLPTGFDEPFKRTSGYFSMKWRGSFYSQSMKGAPLSAAALAEADRLAHSIDHATN